MGEYTGHMLIIASLIIIIIIALTFVAYYAFRRKACMTYPSPFCYTDWSCPGAPTEQQPWNAVMPVVNNCGIISNSSVASPNCQNPWPFLDS